MAICEIAKILLLSIFLLAVEQIVNAQKSAISLNVYSGLFSFRGNGSTSSSLMLIANRNLPDFTVNPYGRKSGSSYAIELQAQRLTKRKHVYGLGISYEMLKSKAAINKVGIGDVADERFDATGKVVLTNAFITLNPFVGHRYVCRNFSVDVLAGLDLGFCLQSKESGKAYMADGYTYKTENVSRNKPALDTRPRIQLKANYNRFGLIAGYSLGLTNFSLGIKEYQFNNNTKAYTSFVRLGVSYRLK